jgi:hypothetical protein
MQEGAQQQEATAGSNLDGLSLSLGWQRIARV